MSHPSCEGILKELKSALSACRSSHMKRHDFLLSLARLPYSPSRPSSDDILIDEEIRKEQIVCQYAVDLNKVYRACHKVQFFCYNDHDTNRTM